MPFTIKLPRHIYTITLAGLYIIITVSILLIILMLWGLTVSDTIYISILVCWSSFCWSASWWQPFLTISRSQVRFPTIEEEQALGRLVADVQAACMKKKGRWIARIDLRIEEEIHPNAFVTGRSILVISRGLIESCNDEELRGVIAHEIGHLFHNDTVVSATFITAHRLHQWFPHKLVYLKRFFLIAKRRLPLIAAIFIICWLMAKQFPFMTLAVSLLYIYSVRYIDRLSYWLWIANARFIEYERDFFAYELGYGSGLCTALEKFSKIKQPVSWSEVIKKHTHPVTQHRIRRLELLNAASETIV